MARATLWARTRPGPLGLISAGGSWESKHRGLPRPRAPQPPSAPHCTDTLCPSKVHSQFPAQNHELASSRSLPSLHSPGIARRETEAYNAQMSCLREVASFGFELVHTAEPSASRRGFSPSHCEPDPSIPVSACRRCLGEATGRSSPARRSSGCQSGQALRNIEEGCGVRVGREEQRKERGKGGQRVLEGPWCQRSCRADCPVGRVLGRGLAHISASPEQEFPEKK